MFTPFRSGDEETNIEKIMANSNEVGKLLPMEDNLPDVKNQCGIMGI